jgi:hypothetical protein
VIVISQTTTRLFGTSYCDSFNAAQKNNFFRTSFDFEFLLLYSILFTSLWFYLVQRCKKCQFIVRFNSTKERRGERRREEKNFINIANLSFIARNSFYMLCTYFSRYIQSTKSSLTFCLLKFWTSVHRKYFSSIHFYCNNVVFFFEVKKVVYFLRDTWGRNEWMNKRYENT